MHFDSDMIFTAPVTPEYFFREGKPVWVKTPWIGLGAADKRTWFHIMAKCLQEAPDAEYMRKGAVVVPRGLYAQFRQFIQDTHGMTMDAYVMRQPGHEFSEYNCLGFFAWLRHREDFYWQDTGIEPSPEWPWKQFWSYGGLTEAVRLEIERALK